jgi:hypothetical protein
MKTQIQIVKVKGLKQAFLGGKFQSYVAVNERMQFGCLPNESTPYLPLGGKKTLESVLSILEFKTF